MDFLIQNPDFALVIFSISVIIILVFSYEHDNHKLKLKPWSVTALIVVGFLFIFYCQEKYAHDMIIQDRIMRDMSPQERREYIKDLEDMRD